MTEFDSLRNASQIPPERLSLNKVVLAGLQPVAAALALLYAILAISHIWLLPPATAFPSVLASLATAIIFFALSLALRRWQVPPSWAHPLAAGMAGLALANGLLRLALSGEPWQSTDVILLIVAAGLLLLSWTWLVAVLLAANLGWGVIALRAEPSPLWSHFAFSLLLASTLSILVHLIRARAYDTFSRARKEADEQWQEIQRSARQMEVSLAISRRVTALLDQNTLLGQVVEIIRERCELYYVGIFLLDDEKQYAVARAGTGRAGRALCETGFRLRIGEEGLIGWAAGQGEAVRVDDVSRDERHMALETMPATRSELVLPLKWAEELVGVLDMQSDRLAAFHEEDVPVLQALAHQIAIAMHNALLYEQARSDRDLAETLYYIGRALTRTLQLEELLDLILEHLAEMVPHDRGAVMLERDGVLRMVRTLGFPPSSLPEEIRVPITEGEQDSDGIYQQIYRTKRPLVIDDVTQRPDWQAVEGLKQARSWLGVPLIHANQVVGMLSMVRETWTPFAESEVALAKTFADQAAIALQNAQLYERSTRFSQQLEYEVRQRTQFLQEAYQQLERLDRTKSDFIGIASHELRTPLTIVTGYSQIMLGEAETRGDDHFTQLAAGILAGSKRMHEILDSMLDMLKIDSRVLELYAEPLQMKEVIVEAREVFKESLAERNLTLTVERDLQELPPIEADRDGLHKVFYHLLMNAIKYTPDGGKIRVWGQMLDQTDYVPGAAIEIVISDSGIGIERQARELIFTKFYQTGEVSLHSSGKTKFKGGGAGLGLAIVKGIVEAHRGRVWVESPGYSEERFPGSQFHVVLPVYQPQRAEGERQAAVA
ncbi:MAG TPA: GAF domain-containing sensor histidine kinase [Candidatus Binatia bacterium]|nr:GAF domain-containing sensor histidine kinase [Candidatus Binatia bacterium]